MKQFIIFFGTLSSFALALFFPSVVLEGARLGLNLWFNTLLPTLLPFMILSNLFIQSGIIQPLMHLPGKFSARYLGISPAGLYALICGFFFGYPSGAKILADLLKTGQIEQEEAAWLIIFCNNASPAFLMTFVLTEHMHHPEWIPETLLILYGVPALLCLIPRWFCRKTLHMEKTVSYTKTASPSFSLSLFDSCISDAISVILKLGCYIMLFAVLANAAANLLPISHKAAALLTAGLEITNGVPAVIQAFPSPLSLVILLPFLAFGGLCSTMQTGSVMKDTPLLWHRYLSGKLLLAIPAFLFGIIWLL